MPLPERHALTEPTFVQTFRNLTGVPSYHYDAVFGRMVHEQFASARPAVVALELPASFRPALEWAPSCWPTPVAAFERGRRSAMGTVMPFVPGDSIFEAFRLASGAGRPETGRRRQSVLGGGDSEEDCVRKEEEMKRAIAGWVIWVIVVLTAAGASAQTETKRLVPEEYAGTTANMTTGAGSKIVIQVFRWSSENDRERVLSSLSADAEKGPDELVKAVAGLPTVGRIWGAGAAGYSLKYAHRVAQADGGERVVVMTDRSLGSLEQPAWKVTGPTEPAKPYTVVELRLNSKGRGDGKMSLTTPVTVDEQTKTIGLANYDKASTLLTDVQRQPKS
jgi:hypothetical protein